LQVQLAHVERFARARQEDSGQHAYRGHQAPLLLIASLRIVGGAYAGAPSFTFCGSTSRAPSRRCSARVFSYMFKAVGMAICIFRHVEDSLQPPQSTFSAGVAEYPL